jgi:hypothetical protein
MFPILAGSNPSGYNLTRSLRFRASASAYLNRTPASATNRKTWTWSGWFKRGALGAGYLFGATSDSWNVNWTLIYFNSSNSLFVQDYATSQRFNLNPTMVFRDPSAWYHLVVAMDTTQATASDRIKIYVNGTQVTAFSTASYPSQNLDTFVDNTVSHQISGTGGYFDGYLAEVNFIDGQALTPSSFGSTNALTGVWQPARYTGTYGTNGFYLPFPLNSAQTYAGSFNGSNQNITAPASANLALSGNLTIEAWVYPTTSTGTRSLVQSRSSGSSGSGYAFGLNSSNQLFVYSASSFFGTSSALSSNQWNHVAWVRSGSTNTFYINGVASGTFSNSSNYSDPSTNITYVGGQGTEFFTGNISNVRINNTAVYTANFIPSAAPLTAISGTQLLTLQNATLIDNSTNAFTLTNNNTVILSAASPFATVSNVTADYSGNGNNWTPNNISLAAGVTYDSMTDVPTLTSATAANFCVLNPLAFVAGATGLSATNGNLTYNNTNASNAYQGFGSMSSPSGKFYFEVTITARGDSSDYAYVGANNTYYANTGRNQALASFGAAYTTGDVIGVAIDTAVGVTYYKNNVSQGTISTTTPTVPFCAGFNSAVYNFNFGQRPFTYTPPTGFVALNTFNLPTSTIVKGNTVMDATLYTGNGSAQTIINAAGFKPDFIWQKARSEVASHRLVDSIRGANQVVYSNLTNAETFESGVVNSFNSNGFTGGSGNVVSSGNNAVAWQWQAGQGSSSSNTNGTITSTVSVNASAGFSVVTYASNGTSSATIGHGLGVAPAMIVAKQRSGTGSWCVYHSAISGAPTNVLYLNLTNALSGNALQYPAAPTSSVFSVGNGNDTYSSTSGTTYVAYCWTPIAGYSAFGSYTGNGSADGTFVYTGFRPKYLMIKRTDNVGSWWTIDTSRSPYNVAVQYLFADSSAAEGSDNAIDILSNGFKLRIATFQPNTSGGTFIYMAFAENPFKNALAR